MRLSRIEGERELKVVLHSETENQQFQITILNNNFTNFKINHPCGFIGKRVEWVQRVHYLCTIMYK